MLIVFMVQTPTKKDFQHLLTFIIRQIDPGFDFTENFEEEMRAYMKSLGYPFSISKSSLAAVGSPHAWPSLLAATLWVVQVVEYTEAVEALEPEENEVVCTIPFELDNSMSIHVT
jgi:kinetochore protein NDC80